MPGPPQKVLEKIEAVQAAEVAAKKAAAAEEAAKLAKIEEDRQNFNKTNEYMEDNYLLSLIKNIGWKLNNIFNASDKSSIMKSVFMSEEEAELLVSTGNTKENADERNMGMWMKLNSTITGKDGDTLEHYFEDIYTKLACCTGQSSIVVPILKRNTTTGKIEKIYKKISVDRSSQCKINNVDWADDNTTEAGYKPHCEDFMQRLIAFLSKYDPENPIIDSAGGCLANKHLDDIDEGILKDPFLLNLVNVNRSCLMPTCNKPEAYKRKEDRKSCTTTICTADISVSDSQAGGAISVFGNQIEQQCGPQSELSSALAKGEDIAEEIIAEKEKELEAEIEATTEELEKTDDSTDSTNFLNFFNNFSLFLSTFFSSLFKTEGFQNYNLNFLSNILNSFLHINYFKYLFFCLIFIVIPFYLYKLIKK